MPDQTALSPRLAAALAVSAVIHGVLLALSLVPVSGKGLAYLPTQTRLSASLVHSDTKASAPTDMENEAPRLIGSDPGADRNNPEITHFAPVGPIESSQSSPYLTSAEVDVRATPIDPPPLILPEFILRQQVRGTVELKVYISADGQVDGIEVVSSSHPGQLEEAAIEVTAATRFSPALKFGVAVKSVKRIGVVFDPEELQGEPGPAPTPIPSATGKPRSPDSPDPAGRQ
jgi:TonB family protein